MRATFHLGVLVLLGVMTLGGLGAKIGWEAVRAESSIPDVGAAPKAAAAGGGPAPSGPARPAGGPAIESTRAQVLPAPALAPAKRPPRRWVQNFRPSELFAGPERGAARLGAVGQFTTYELVEGGDGAAAGTGSGRVKLFDPGLGVGRLPGYVWADPKDFGPSGPPQPLFELTDGGGPDPTTGRPAPERVGGWPRVPTAELAVVLDGDSGAILYGKNAHGQVAPASLTKILTAIVAIEHGKPQDKVRIDIDSRTMWDSTVMGLQPGDVISLETLLYGLMLPSGNDAALAIGRYISGSDDRFVELMNGRARTLGLEDTQIRNPHGLDEPGHYSSPYDLATMARHGMQDPLFYHLSATRNWHAEGFDLWNLNRLLGQYPGADGVKVGYTDDAGRCIVSSATRNGHRVFVSLIRSHDPVGESRMLLDYAFQNFRWP
ncbi:MAG: D-alanyl-D-alanine carboxypeptidase [Chloroflexi bacterium]|nr:D-alanyl-D-alanine carboxypeptidase [Chloroflexota bacterium]